MLIELRIRNFAVIQNLSLELGTGLNVLTGETGAGKSIIVGALSLLLGERASSDVVRSGEESALLEAVFDLQERPDLLARLDELGFSAEDGLLLVRREVQSQGRNRAWINGSPATAATLGQFGRRLVDLHGQHEHQTLLRGPEQRDILDAFAGAEPQAKAMAEKHEHCARLHEELAQVRARQSELARRSELLRFQFQEIERARVDPAEDDRVDAELRRLEHAEELARDSDAVHRILYAGEESVSDALARARQRLGRITRVDADAGELLEELDELYHRAVDLGQRAGRYAAGVEVSPARAEALRSRADLLFRLKRKYGPELSDVLETGYRIAAELAELEGTGLEADQLERAIDQAEGELEVCRTELSHLRAEAAEVLQREVQAALPEIGLPGARFQVRLEPAAPAGRGGAERILFVASLNRGFDPRPLARIVSGGELSRIMLALKSILALQDRVPTLVFDEIDAGIGGSVAAAVGRKLREVAEHHQVFVVTHLAQLASRGHRHLLVQKAEGEGVVRATVAPLLGENRVREIARMLGGDPESKKSRDHAEELLSAG